jgi:hypothetical protein
MTFNGLSSVNHLWGKPINHCDAVGKDIPHLEYGLNSLFSKVALE